MHNDLIMSAKQKRLKASDFIGARVTSLQLSPIRWKDSRPGACGGLRGHHAEGLIRHRKIGTCKAGTAARFATEPRNVAARCEYSSTILGYYKWATPGF